MVVEDAQYFFSKDSSYRRLSPQGKDLRFIRPWHQGAQMLIIRESSTMLYICFACHNLIHLQPKREKYYILGMILYIVAGHIQRWKKKTVNKSPSPDRKRRFVRHRTPASPNFIIHKWEFRKPIKPICPKSSPPLIPSYLSPSPSPPVYLL